MENGSAIENILKQYTTHDKWHIYPTYDKLVYIINKICDCKETIQYISITPFYKNPKYCPRPEFEFEGNTLFIECRDSVSMEEREKFVKECSKPIDSCSDPYSDSPENQYFLCEYSDADYFASCLRKYMAYLITAFPKMYAKMERVVKELGYDEKDFIFGYIDFEVCGGNDLYCCEEWEVII